MADDDKVLVRARGDAPTPYFHPDPRSDDSRRRIGRVYKESPTEKGRWGWEATGENESVPKSLEVAQAIAQGHLWPGDAAAATWAMSMLGAGVKIEFDPSFGASPPKASKPSGGGEK